MDLQNKSELELYIDLHSGSKLSPILVDLNLQQDMAGEAISLCQKIITEDPGSPYAYYLLALAEIKNDDPAAAAEHLKQAIDLDYGFLDAYYLLVEIGKELLPPGALKVCYNRIFELNPFDTNAKTEENRISEDADPFALRDIHLPEIKVQQTFKRESTVAAAPEPEPEPIVSFEPEPEPVPEIEQISEPESFYEEPARPIISEEEAHMGPMIDDEEEEPEIDLDLPLEKILENEPDTYPEPKPTPLKSIQPEPVFSSPAPIQEKPHIPPASSGAASSVLSDMFSKLRTKPLEEVQKENWSLPVVEAPETEPDPNELLKKPNVKFTVPLKEEIDPQKKLEDIHKEIGINPIESSPEESPKDTATSINEPPPEKPVSNNISVKSKEANNSKVELKIPVPTFTLVDVFKKQKLYDEALQLLDVLEKKSKNPERIEKERREILKLQMEEG